MPYNIVLDSNQQFSSGPSSSARVNDWIFDPAPTLQLTYVIADSTPADVDIDTIIKNYLRALDLSVYSEIKVYALVNFNGSVSWFALSGEIQSASPGGYELEDEADLEVTNTLSYQNLNQLNIGVYNATISFVVTATTTHASAPELIEQVSYNIQLNVIDGNTINVTPEVLNYSFLRDGDLPTAQDLDVVTDSTWTLTADKKITVSGTGLTDLSTATQTIVQGTGNKTISIGFAAALNDVVGQTFNTQIHFSNVDGFSDAVQVTLNIFESETFIFEPPTLSFFAIQNLQEATPLNFNVFGFGDFTLASPSWLTLSNASGTNTGTFTATPFNSNSMTPGVYTGNIVLTDDNDPANTYNLPVTYIVAGTIYTPLDDGNINFTKDIEYFNIYNVNEGPFPEVNNVAKIKLIFTIFNYITFLPDTQEFDYFLPFNKNATKIHIGEITERLMKKLQQTTDVGITNLQTFSNAILPVYKPAKVTAEVEILNRSSGDIVFSETIYDMLFVAGKKPDIIIDNSGILSHAFDAKRVTVNSVEILNFLATKPFYSLSIKKNDDDYTELLTQAIGTNNIFRYVFDFSSYAPGDKVTIKLNDGTNDFEKTYQMFPEGKHSNHIAFINRFQTLELFEFTGDWQFNSDIKIESTEFYRDLVKVLEKTESSNKMTVKINTGFILRENQTIVDEIIRNKKAWFMFPDKPGIELVALGKKLTNYDSEAELYNYELEFEINRKHDLENFTF